MNTIISFDLAKLLKEKGYRILPDFKSSYPTIAEVVMWLYEKHGIWIWVEINGIDKTFDYHIHNLNTLSSSSNIEGYHFYSPTEAYEEAIKLTLNELI